jgi:hypothetical protein
VAFTDIATLQFQAHLATGQAVRNTLHFRRNPTAGSVDATWLAAWLADANTTALINAYKAVLRTTDRLDGVLARATQDPTDADADRDEAYRDVNAAGTRSETGTGSPDELTVILKLSSDLAGRRFRGRIWMPPPGDQEEIYGEDVYTGGDYWSTMTALVAELVKTTYPSGGSHYAGAWNDCDMIVYSRKGRTAGDTYWARVAALGRPAKLHWLRSRNPTQA